MKINSIKPEYVHWIYGSIIDQGKRISHNFLRCLHPGESLNALTFLPAKSVELN